jgi:hypothetical protein
VVVIMNMLSFILYLCLLNYKTICLIGTWRTTQEIRTTTRHMALPWLNNKRL